MKNRIVLLALLLAGIMLANAQEVKNKKAVREEQAQRAVEATRQLVESRNFQFFADRLISATGTSQSIAATPNTIRIEGDQVKIYLPYVGEVRANSPYQVDGGIKYEGVLQDFSVDFRDSKRMTVVEFSIDRGIEHHDFYMYINKDGHTRVTVISSGRTSISYYGPTTDLSQEGF